MSSANYACSAQNYQLPLAPPPPKEPPPKPPKPPPPLPPPNPPPPKPPPPPIIPPIMGPTHQPLPPPLPPRPPPRPIALAIRDMRKISNIIMKIGLGPFPCCCLRGVRATGIDVVALRVTPQSCAITSATRRVIRSSAAS